MTGEYIPFKGMVLKGTNEPRHAQLYFFLLTWDPCLEFWQPSQCIPMQAPKEFHSDIFVLELKAQLRAWKKNPDATSREQFKEFLDEKYSQTTMMTEDEYRLINQFMDLNFK
jgi:hypothetical protein